MHNKNVLGEFIFKLNEKNSFHLFSPFWSDIVLGFQFNRSLPEKYLYELRKKEWYTESTDDVICILGEWREIAEGIIFTESAMYVNAPKNIDKQFKVRYKEISCLKYLTLYEPELQIETTRGEIYKVDTPIWSKRNIHDFLQFACQQYEFDEKNKDVIHSISIKQLGKNVGAIAAGTIYSNISNASSNYFDDKIVSPRGHGFAAENANHLKDVFLGRDAKIVGNDNAKNGADRIVDGIQIQSKYCASGAKCVQECFDNGAFRYWNPDGTPMQIEVPSDMYDSAIQAMESRISKGEVRGVKDPAEAKNIIRKGHFTYAQVKNIAKAGTVESITYDAASGTIVAINAFGITAVLSFATALWNNEDIDVALKSAISQGLKVGGTSFVTAVLAGQLSKAGMNSLLVGSSEALVKIIGPKASAVLVNAFRSGTNIYGAAAMKSLAKMLRANAITGVVSFAVLSIGDVINIFSGRISGAQLFKNLTKTAANVVGGGVGWAGGAAAGAKAGAAIGTVIPVVGPALGATVGGIVGGIAGAFGGGAVASGVTGAVLDSFIEDDADKMVVIIQEVFTGLASEYLINQSEAEQIVKQLQDKLTGNKLKDMFASANHYSFARKLLEQDFIDISQKRDHIALPSQEEMQRGLRMVLEDLADEQSIGAASGTVDVSEKNSAYTEVTTRQWGPAREVVEKEWKILEKTMENAVKRICNVASFECKISNSVDTLVTDSTITLLENVFEQVIAGIREFGKKTLCIQESKKMEELLDHDVFMENAKKLFENEIQSNKGMVQTDCTEEDTDKRKLKAKTQLFSKIYDAYREFIKW